MKIVILVLLLALVAGGAWYYFQVHKKRPTAEETANAARFLEAGAKAEAEGKLHAAELSYQYIVDHYSKTKTAEDARAAVERVRALRSELERAAGVGR
jgi:predicted negative regulator of RcsB-dependent stress response